MHRGKKKINENSLLPEFHLTISQKKENCKIREILILEISLPPNRWQAITEHPSSKQRTNNISSVDALAGTRISYREMDSLRYRMPRIRSTKGKGERKREKSYWPREPYTPRRRRINKDFPSRAFSRTGEYFKHPTPPFLSPPAYSRFYYLGARNIFYRLDTASKLSLSLSVFPQLWSFFFSSFCGYRGYEYVRRGCFHDACWVSLFFFWKKGKFLIFFWSPFILFIRLEFIFYYLGYYWRRLSAIL